MASPGLLTPAGKVKNSGFLTDSQPYVLPPLHFKRAFKT